MRCEDSDRQIPINQEQGESTMSNLDTLAEQFERLLEGVSGKYSLAEWRYAYEKVIYFGAMKILEDFPEIIVGPPPPPMESKKGPAPAHGGPATLGKPIHPVIAGQSPPYHPSSIGKLVCIVLGNCPEPTSS
jgi:hypothetical protein